jgi:hypothetical protein
VPYYTRVKQVVENGYEGFGLGGDADSAAAPRESLSGTT